VDLDAVRTFVAVADRGRFSDAASTLSITQQAVSKRVAALERDLGVRLFVRGPHGTRLTIDGQALLPHARDLLRAEERAESSVRPGHRALRVDVVSRRVVTAVVIQSFHESHPEVDLDIVTLDVVAEVAVDAVAAGEIDATFHAIVPALELPDGVRVAPVIEEPHQLLVGPRHPLADAKVLSPTQLAGHHIWMPGLADRGEVTAYYDEFASAFGFTIDVLGPVFGYEALLAEIADSGSLATLVGPRSRYLWPDSYDLRRIPLRTPTPVYPMSIVWRHDNPHHALRALRNHLLALHAAEDHGSDTWTPKWTHAS
jgi:DNA-binding transcriptional LysR family regulator